MDCLKEVGDDFRKNVSRASLYDKIQKAIRLLYGAWTQALRNDNLIENRLARIEEMMKVVLLVFNSFNRSFIASQKACPGIVQRLGGSLTLPMAVSGPIFTALVCWHAA
jgi:hypothetical protein